MKKVYQTIIDDNKGNCMQAAVASLLDKKLEEVPNFVEMRSPNHELMKYMKKLGYGYTFFDVHYHTKDSGLLPAMHSLEFIKKLLKVDGGIGGYFFAVVPSRVFPFPICHAVIVDSDLNVVHDVNPKGLCLDMTAKDIIYVMTNSEKWYIEEINGEPNIIEL